MKGTGLREQKMTGGERMDTEESGEDGADDKSEGEVNDKEAEDDRDDEAEGEDKEEEAECSRETQAVSEEHIEFVGEEDEVEQKPEEVEETVEKIECEVLEVDESLGVDERAARRNLRMARRLDEILAAKRAKGKELEY